MLIILQVDEKRIRKVAKTIGLELTDESVDNPDGSNLPEMFVLKDKGIIEIRSTLDKGKNQINHSKTRAPYSLYEKFPQPYFSLLLLKIMENHLHIERKCPVNRSLYSQSRNLHD